ncbi:hypothetical protein KCU99_g406, partial [Aureobasidium melanogenum]
MSFASLQLGQQSGRLGKEWHLHILLVVVDALSVCCHSLSSRLGMFCLCFRRRFSWLLDVEITKVYTSRTRLCKFKTSCYFASLASCLRIYHQMPALTNRSWPFFSFSTFLDIDFLSASTGERMVRKDIDRSIDRCS